MLQLFWFNFLLELFCWIGKHYLEAIKNFICWEKKEDLVFRLIVDFHNPEAMLTLSLTELDRSNFVGILFSQLKLGFI
jgi:hypothetical protein